MGNCPSAQYCNDKLLRLGQWFITGGHTSPGSVKKFPRDREPLRALQHGKFLNRKVFRPSCLFKVIGAWNKEQLRGREKVKNHWCWTTL